MHDIITRLRAKKDDEGFTLIELLVVVVIIGVLVAIAVPVYLNYRQGAYDKSAQSDLRGAVSAVEQVYTSNGNVYPAAATAEAVGAVTSMDLKIGTVSVGTVTLSEKTKMNYYTVGTPVTSYRLCTINSGGTTKYYLYDSTKAGSVTSSTTITSTNFTTCGPTP